MALFSKAPHYFSKRAPYRVVAVAAMGNGPEREFDDECNTMSGSNLENMLRQLFLTDTATQQEDSGATGTTTLVRLARLVQAISRHQKRVLKCGPGRFLWVLTTRFQVFMLLTPWRLCSERFEGGSICPWQHNNANESRLGGATEKDGPVYFPGGGSAGFAVLHGGK